MNLSSSNHSANPPSKGLRLVLQRHPLICFYVMAFGFSWIAWLPYVLSQGGLGIWSVRLPLFAGLLPGLYLGPLLAVFIMETAVAGKAGVRDLLRRLFLWRVSWWWYLFALIGIPVIIIIGGLLMALVMGSVADLRMPPSQTVLSYPLVLIMQIVVSGLGEEPGWRGFALPRLQQLLGPLPGTLLIGFLWGCWHLPLFLTDWADPATSLPVICEFIFLTMASSIIITWVLNLTRGSILMAILLHSTFDAFCSVAWPSLFATPMLHQNAFLGLDIGYGIAALLLIVVTRGQLSYQKALPLSDPETTTQANQTSSTV